jgi:hypothetical protein
MAAAAAGLDEPDGDGKHREILDEILAMLHAFGAGVTDDFDQPLARMHADERMAEPTTLLAAPWAPTVQVIRVLGSVPTPASCDFSSVVEQLDLSDLGEQSPWYTPIRPRRSRRGGRPDRPSRLSRSRGHA